MIARSWKVEIKMPIVEKRRHWGKIEKNSSERNLVFYTFTVFRAKKDKFANAGVEKRRICAKNTITPF